VTRPLARLEQVADVVEAQARPEGADTRAGVTPNRIQTGLKVKDVMNQDVVTAAPGESTLSAARRMSAHNVSCVVVVDNDAVMGILTQKDLLFTITQGQAGGWELPVAERMSPPIIVPAELPVIEAGRILKARCVKHLAVVSERRLVGIVTQTDITRGLIYLTALQRVSQVMSPRIATVGVEATAADAAHTMCSQNISCVVVMQLGEPVGIISQKDILTRVISLQRDPARTRAVDVMSTPILPIPSDYPIFTASRIMDKMHVHRLVVHKERRVCGIISQTDVLEAVERRLREEERHRLFLTRSEIPLFTLDAEGTVTYVNAAFLRLLDYETCDGLAGTTFLDEGLWSTARDKEQLRQTLRAGQSALLRLAVRTDTNAVKQIFLLLAVMRSDSEEIVGWQGVAWQQD
jgi:PAS domain S-box-containing protein